MFCGRIRVLGAALRDLGCVCCSGQPAVPISARKINCAKSAKIRKNGLRIWLSPVLAHLNLNVLRADKGTGCPERPRMCFVQGSPKYPYPPAKLIAQNQILRPFFGDFGDFADFAQLILRADRSEEHTSELQSRPHLLCRLLLDYKS